MGCHALIITIVPLSDVLREGDFPFLLEASFMLVTKQRIKRSHSPDARTAEDVLDFRRINQLSRPYQHFTSVGDLPGAVFREQDF